MNIHFQAIRSVTEKILQEASKEGLRTVSFPAIGTGKLNFPIEVVAQSMIQTIQAFGSTVGSTGVSDVNIVLFDTRVIEVSISINYPYIPVVYWLMHFQLLIIIVESYKHATKLNKLNITHIDPFKQL